LEEIILQTYVGELVGKESLSSIATVVLLGLIVKKLKSIETELLRIKIKVISNSLKLNFILRDHSDEEGEEEIDGITKLRR